MVAKISFGNSLYGALAYNGEKINKEQGKLLATNKIFDDCSGKTSIANAMRDFERYLSPHIRTEKPVVHISLNPHPDDVLTDMEMENIAREYLERMGYGDQPYMLYKHEDIDRHHMHIVTIRVDGNGKCLDSRYNYHRSKAITRDLEEKYCLRKAERKQRQHDNPLRNVDWSTYHRGKFKADRKSVEMAKHSIEAILKQTHHKDKFIELLKAKGIEVVLRHTADGRRIYGATFIDHRTKSVFNGSQLGKNVSANALQEHFTLPYENEQPMPLTLPKEEGATMEQEQEAAGLFDEYGSGLGLMSGAGSSNELQEAAFDKALRRKKKKRKGPRL